MDVLAMRFLAVGFVLVPLATAITVELLIANSVAAPLVAGAIAWKRTAPHAI